MKIKCLIVDDEHAAREGLRVLLDEYKNIEVVGVCKNGMEAINEIQALAPDLVLLDIQMPHVSGFEVLASLPKPHPHVIFITAHDDHAIKAFEINALDYLLKPFSDERFDQAIKKAMKTIQLLRSQNQEVEGRNMTKTNSQEIEERKLSIKVDGVIRLVDFGNIRFVEAFDYYIKIHTSNGFHLVRDTMKNIAQKLDSGQFLRIHNSFIANRKYAASLQRGAGSEYELALTDGTPLKVSRGKIADVKKWINSD